MGGRNSTTATWTAKSGDTEIWVLVDHVQSSDTNLTNNQALVVVHVNDTQPPSIWNVGYVPVLPSTSEMIEVSCNASDDLALQSKDPVVLRYQYDSSWHNQTMALATKQFYSCQIGIFKESHLNLSIIAEDSAGNLAWHNFTVQVYMPAITLSLDKASVPVGEAIAASGNVMLSGTIVVGSTNVNITVEKSSPLISKMTQTDVYGNYSLVINAPDEPGNYQVLAVTTYAGVDYFAIAYLETYLPYPDISVDAANITQFPNWLDTGDAVTICVTLGNSGRENGTCRLQLFDGAPGNGGQVFHSTDIYISHGGSNTTEAIWTAVSGTTEIYAVVDHVLPADTNLTNNQAFIVIAVNDTSLPFISNVSYEPQLPPAGHAVEVSCEIWDDLALDKTTPVNLEYVYDGMLQSMPMLLMATNYTATIGPFNESLINISISAIDTSGNAGYNNFSLRVYQPMLTLAVQPPSTHTGVQFLASGEVSLSGAIPIAGMDVNVSIDKSNPPVYGTGITDFNGSYTIVLTAPLDPGVYNVSASFFYLDKMYAQAARLDAYLPNPDMFVDAADISLDIQWPGTGDKITVSTTIRNLGREDGTCRVRIFQGQPSDGLLIHEANSTIMEGTTVQTQGLWIAPSGIHEIYVVVDHVQPYDVNITNNQAFITVAVNDTSAPSISGIQMQPEQPLAGEQITVRCIVEEDLAINKGAVILSFMNQGIQQVYEMNKINDTGYEVELDALNRSTYDFTISATDDAENTGQHSFSIQVLPSGVQITTMYYLTTEAEKGVWINGTVSYPEGDAPEEGSVMVLVDGQDEWADDIEGGNFSIFISHPLQMGDHTIEISAITYAGLRQLSAATSVWLHAFPTYPDFYIPVDGIVVEIPNSDNEPHTVHVLVHNAGRKPATAQITMYSGMPSNGSLIGASSREMDVGSSHYFSFSWMPEPGQHTLTALVASADKPENNTFNNRAVKDIQVEEMQPGDEPGLLPFSISGLSDITGLLILAALLVLIYISGRRHSLEKKRMKWYQSRVNVPFSPSIDIGRGAPPATSKSDAGDAGHVVMQDRPGLGMDALDAHSVSCPTCNNLFAVPEFGKLYRCPYCSGVVRADVPYSRSRERKLQ
jgi:hypothetical protein